MKISKRIKEKKKENAPSPPLCYSTTVAGTAGAVVSAVTGAVVADCCYGSGKSSVPVINISKKNKKKEKHT